MKRGGVGSGVPLRYFEKKCLKTIKNHSSAAKKRVLHVVVESWGDVTLIQISEQSIFWDNMYFFWNTMYLDNFAPIGVYFIARRQDTVC